MAYTKSNADEWFEPNGDDPSVICEPEHELRHLHDGEQGHEYRGYRIELVTYRNDYGAWFMHHKWRYEHPDFDADPGFDNRIGSAKTMSECCAEIDEIEEERDEAGIL